MSSERDTIAVISDPHARAERLAECLAQVRGLGIERIWCLGDLVGYGDDAGSVVARVREEAELVLQGNHDASVTGDADWFYEVIPPWLQLSHRRARAQLSHSEMEWLRGLKPAARREGIVMAHGTLSDPLFGSSEDFTEALSIFNQISSVCLVGHTHLPLAMGHSGGREVELIQPGGGESVDLNRHSKWILNPGTSGLYQSDRWPENVPPRARGGRPNEIDRRSGWMELRRDERGRPSQAIWHRLGPVPRD